MRRMTSLTALFAATILAGCATAQRTLPDGHTPLAANFAVAVGSDHPDLRQSLGTAMDGYLARRLAGELPDDDARFHADAARRALWDNTEGYGESWHNPRSRDSGSIKPTSPVFREGEAVCRDFHDVLHQHNRPLLGVDGVACLRGSNWTVDY